MSQAVDLDLRVVGPEIERTPDKFYPSLQGMRGFAALSVIFVHIQLMSTHGGFFPSNLPPAVLYWLKTFGAPTALFFVISGFLIPASLFRHKDIKKFFLDRLLRIMPVYVSLHCMVFFVGPFIGYKWLSGIGIRRYIEYFVTNLTFTALPLGLPLAQQNSWTLSYEWGFYIFFSIAWALLNRSHAKRWVLVATGLLTLSICIALPRCCPFLLGLALARWRPALRLSPLAEIVLVPVSVVMFYYCSVYVGNLASIPFAYVIFWAALQDASYTSRLLCAEPMQFLGKVSYSFYLLHPFVAFGGQLLCQRLIRHGMALKSAFILFAIITLAITPIFSVISYTLLEVKFRRKLANWIECHPKKSRLGESGARFHSDNKN